MLDVRAGLRERTGAGRAAGSAGPRRCGVVALAALLALALASAGCAGWHPKPSTCALVGAVAGAAGGAAVGAEMDEGSDNTGIGVGGGAGALAVGALGYTVCRLAQAQEPPPPPPPAPEPEPAPPPPPEEPEEAIPAPPEEEVQERIVLRGVNFDFDKATIRPDAAVILSEAARILSENPEVDVRIEGHTDATGPESYNQQLSERRAQSVEDYLVEEGIAAERLRTRGYGESQPVASNETREGRALNRRVELSVVR